MKTINAIKKLEKNGFEIFQGYIAIKDHKARIEIFTQDDEVVFYTVLSKGDVSDPIRDYSAGTHTDNLNHAMQMAQY